MPLSITLNHIDTDKTLISYVYTTESLSLADNFISQSLTIVEKDVTGTHSISKLQVEPTKLN